MGFEDLNVEELAREYIEKGKIVEGYTLILLQLIRNDLRDIKKFQYGF